MEYSYRIIYQVLFTAQTPLKVGSGDNSLLSDTMVCSDANGLPYIPGSSLAGILRHALKEEDRSKLFGDGTHGSNIIISDANLVYEDGKVVEGLLPNKTPFLSMYTDLPIRQHVRIGLSGTAEKGGNFDEQIVFAGSRFCFQMEILCKEEPEMSVMNNILSHMSDCDFRIGGGSRRGFGKIVIDKIVFVSFDLTKEDALNLYLMRTASLNDTALKEQMSIMDASPDVKNSWETIKVELTPENYFLFGSGFGDEDSDITPVYETRVQWEGRKPILERKCILVPASSIKGALAHRTAFYYNQINERFADRVEDIQAFTGTKNTAVLELFGTEGSDAEQARRGKVVFSDVYLETTTEKIFDHVVIDSYTGGSLDGGLFNEKVVGTNESITLDILVDKSAFNKDENVEKAFRSALQDLCDGFLPIGCGVNRGHGVFIGRII